MEIESRSSSSDNDGEMTRKKSKDIVELEFEDFVVSKFEGAPEERKQISPFKNRTGSQKSVSSLGFRQDRD
jgi:hypothetical protein